MSRRLRTLSLAGMLCVGLACHHPPPSLSPSRQITWQANEIVVTLGIVQHAAIGLNAIQVCEPLPCWPLVSDDDTRIVIDAVTNAVRTIEHVPVGWRGTALAALDVIERRLNAAGLVKLRPYLAAARAAVQSIQP